MVESNDHYYERKTFGKNAEDCFKLLMSSLPEWRVVDYGIEQHIDFLKEHLKDLYDNISEKIRHMPDFVLINKKENKVLLVEVKRLSFIDKRNPDKLVFGFKKNLIEKLLANWKEAKLVVVHQDPPYFYLINLDEINVEKHKIKGDIFNRFSNAIDYKKPMNNWNFKDIVKDIKEIFPDLKDEAIEKVRKTMILHDPEEKNDLDKTFKGPVVLNTHG